MQRYAFHLFLLFCPILLAAQAGPAPNDPSLAVEAADLRIEQRADGGFHLFIRKKPGIGSVLLTETTRDPALREDNFAYRAAEWNAVNGEEVRILDGVPIPRGQIWSLIDSTPENHPALGEAFHIYIPYILYYGYENTRHGEVYVVDGTYFNIRAFYLPGADYRGRFRDNPFQLRVTQRPLPGPPEGNFMKDTVDNFSEISGRGGGKLIYATHETLVDKIRDALLPERGRPLDLVICFDTTGSMKDDIDAVRKALVPMLEELLPSFPRFRIGLVLYKDYYEEYLTRKYDFTADFGRIQQVLNGARTGGGKDIPEAVYEALYDGITGFAWEAPARLLLLIGDAPAHLRPRGKVTSEMVWAAAEEKNITIHAIILPQ